jgi:transposase
MRRDGLRIDSQTLWDQLDALAVHLQPTYEAIIQEILSNPVIHADETRWELLANGKTKENKTFQAWGLVAPELVAYRILDSRGKEAAATVLRDYAGVVMADAYTVYQSLAAEKKTFVVANCWAHYAGWIVIRSREGEQAPDRAQRCIALGIMHEAAAPAPSYAKVCQSPLPGMPISRLAFKPCGSRTGCVKAPPMPTCTGFGASRVPTQGQHHPPLT